MASAKRVVVSLPQPTRVLRITRAQPRRASMHSSARRSGLRHPCLPALATTPSCYAGPVRSADELAGLAGTPAQRSRSGALLLFVPTKKPSGLGVPVGAAMAAKGSRPEAEALLVKGYEGMKAREAKIPTHVKEDRLTEGLQRVIGLYEAWGKPEQASQWRKKGE